MNYKTGHPERQPDEIYLGNWIKQSYHNIGWVTKRAGKKSYDTSGTAIRGCFPAFIKKSEVQQKIDKLKKEGGKDREIALFSAMIENGCANF